MNNKYQMGVSTNLKYKGISLGIDFDIRQGGVMHSRTKDINYFTGNAIQTAYNDRNPLIVPNSVNKIVNGENVTYVENTTPITSSNIYKYWGDGGSEYGKLLPGRQILRQASFCCIRLGPPTQKMVGKKLLSRQ
ncbi:hypothetical protein NXY21_24220 [Bacteroides thetaiotaomicron]|nr:hypothetical protein [Bacteroides thetaiotaomicron]